MSSTITGRSGVGSTAAKVIPDARFARLELVSAREREGDDDNDESANEAELAHRCTPASHTLTLALCLTNSACIPVRKLILRWWEIPLQLCVTLGTKKMCLELTSCHDFHEGVSGFRLIMVDLVGRSVGCLTVVSQIN